MQFLCVAGPLATPYPLCLPELPGHCTWEGEGGEGGPRSGFLQDQDTAAASTRQRLESYICGICEPAPGCILVTGHHSVSNPRINFPQAASSNDIRFSILRILWMCLLWYCEHWMLEIADLSCRHWDILVWLNSSLPNIFHRIVSKGVLELIQKKNEIQRKYIFFWRGFDCTSFMKTDVDTDVNLICVTFQKISWYNIRWQKTNLIRSILRDPS